MTVQELFKNQLTKYDGFFSARRLAILSLILWTSSLFLSVFGINRLNGNMIGLEILIAGWLGPLALNFAWYANIFYLYCIPRILSGNVSIIPAFLSFCLSLQAFSFDIYPSTNGAGTEIFGYGIGFVFWNLSIYLMLASSGKLHREQYSKFYGYEDKTWMEFVGFSAAIIILFISSFFTISDRLNYPHGESRDFEGLLFKNGDVCERDDFIMNSPIEGFSGSVEVIYDGDIQQGTHVEDLLELGISIVKNNGVDFSIKNIGPENLLTSKNSLSEANALLRFTDNRAILTDKVTDRIVFDISLDEEYQPRGDNCIRHPMRNKFSGNFKDAITYALQLPSKSNNDIDEHINWESKKYIGKSISYRYLSSINHDDFVNDKLKCNKSIGIHSNDIEGMGSSKISVDFYGNVFYLNSDYALNALCTNDSVFIYKGEISNGTFNLFLRQRDITTFRDIWHANILIDNIDLYDTNLEMRIVDIQKVGNELFVRLFNEKINVTYDTMTLLQNPL